MSLPDLRRHPFVVIDLETYDPLLESCGPGWATCRGDILGVSVYSESYNDYVAWSPEVQRWIKELCAESMPKIFHNASYDVGWLNAYGIKVNGTLIDTMLAAPLIDENRFSYSLDALGKDYLGEGKEDMTKKEKSDLRVVPFERVREYAKKDTELTYRLWKVFEPILKEQELESVFKLESDLLQMFVDMRMQGVRVDTLAAETLIEQFKKEEIELDRQIRHVAGMDVGVNKARDISKAFAAMGLPIKTTEKGNPSFTEAVLKEVKHPLSALILDRRKIEKARSTFLEGAILGTQHNGRIHANINQLKSDGSGTVSGRLSYSMPNLQQIPARNERMQKAIRGLFLPEEGARWASLDYSQQEPRLTVHYASVKGFSGSAEAVKYYSEDPDADYHTLVARMMYPTYDQVDDKTRKKWRTHAKVINLGLTYGMGKAKLAKDMGVSIEEAEKIIALYHSAIPYARELMNCCSNLASMRGYIRTLSGRRCRFEMYQKPYSKGETPLPKDKAVEKWGLNVQRAFTYVGLNRLIQGGAADQTKMAMLDIYRAGILPSLQIHDELNLSAFNDGMIETAKRCMIEAVKLRVPVTVDVGLGSNWAEAS